MTTNITKMVSFGRWNGILETGCCSPIKQTRIVDNLFVFHMNESVLVCLLAQYTWVLIYTRCMVDYAG